MKKQKIFKAILVTGMGIIAAATAGIGITACKSDEDEHKHTYSQEWNKDATNHWHDATCDHANEKSELAAHDTNGTDGACSVCGYKPTVTPEHEHVYSAWQNDATEHYKTCTGENCTEPTGTKFEKATHDTNGTDGACSVCGYKPAPVTPTHEHTYSETWEKDGNKHWQTCTGENCTEAAGTKFNEAAHDTNGTNGDCSVCGYHVHSYATEWSHDVTNHWHAAICGHDTEKSGVAAHNTSGAGGACSVCGFGGIYAELSAKDGMIISEDFETPNEKLPEFSGMYGTQGLYSYNGATAGHYVKVEGGIAQMVKPDNGETALFVDFGLTSGTVEGYFEATVANTNNNSWTIIRFVNASGSEVFGLRSEKDKGLCYRLNGGSSVSGNNNVAFSQTTYKIYFKLDGSKFTMTINGVDFVKDLVLSTDVFGGVRFVSGNSHNGVINVDNLVIVNDITFADLKAAMITKLQATYAAYDLENNYKTNGADVTSAKEAGETAITAAETKDALQTAYNGAVKAMKDVKSDLTIYKDGKIEELETYATAKGESNYTAENWADIQSKVTEGTADINNAKDTAAVDAALEAVKAYIDAVPDSSLQAELNARDDCPATIEAEGTPQVFDGTANPPKSNSNLTDKQVLGGFLTYIKGTSDSNLNKGGYLSIKGGGKLKFTTTSADATLTLVYTSTSTGRTFDITIGGVKVVEAEEPAKWTNKTNTFTLETAGEYTIEFDTNEHKIGTITLTEVAEMEVTAKVNKVEATVVETATAGVAVADLVSKITVQLDYNGETISGEITEKDQFTVIVKNGEEVVNGETLAAGTYTVIVIFGSGREESAATKYNSHTYTVTVEAAAVTPVTCPIEENQKIIVPVGTTVAKLYETYPGLTVGEERWVLSMYMMSSWISPGDSQGLPGGEYACKLTYQDREVNFTLAAIPACPVSAGSSVNADVGTAVSALYENYSGLVNDYGKWELYMQQGEEWVKLNDTDTVPSEGSFSCKLVFEGEVTIKPADVEFTLVGAAVASGPEAE